MEKGLHFGAQVWISMPFLDLSERVAARKRVCILEQECGFLCPFGQAAAWKKGNHFKVSGRE